MLPRLTIVRVANQNAQNSFSSMIATHKGKEPQEDTKKENLTLQKSRPTALISGGGEK